MNRLDFEGRTAVVTGGAAGIGRRSPQRLALSGARVACGTSTRRRSRRPRRASGTAR